MKKRNKFSTLPKSVIILFFIIGVISAISFRILIVFRYHQQHLFRPIWYIGIIGYVYFFLYRWIIANRRKKMIQSFDLLSKLEKEQPLEGGSRKALHYIITSLSKSKENYNYYIIFFLSIIAIITDLLLAA